MSIAVPTLNGMRYQSERGSVLPTVVKPSLPSPINGTTCAVLPSLLTFITTHVVNDVVPLQLLRRSLVLVVLVVLVVGGGVLLVLLVLRVLWEDRSRT